MDPNDPQGNTLDELLSVKDAAFLLKMSPGWLYGSGIPFVRLGRNRRYRRRDLLSHVERHLSHSKSRGGK